MRSSRCLAIQIKAECEERLQSRSKIISANQSHGEWGEWTQRRIARLANCTVSDKEVEDQEHERWSKIGSKGDGGLYKTTDPLGRSIAKRRISEQSSGWKRERFLILWVSSAKVVSKKNEILAWNGNKIYGFSHFVFRCQSMTLEWVARSHRSSTMNSCKTFVGQHQVLRS